MVVNNPNQHPLFAQLLADADRCAPECRWDVSRLFCFVHGAAYGDEMWWPVLSGARAVLDVGDSWPTLDASALCRLLATDTEEAAARYRWALAEASKDMDPATSNLVTRDFRTLLQGFAKRAPMYAGTWSAADARLFIEGFLSVQDSECKPERLALSRMNARLNEELGWPGRWDCVLDIQSSGMGARRLWYWFELANSQ